MQILIISLFFIISSNIFANEKNEKSECKNRGDLDILYCDENNDLVADSPKNFKDLKNPKTLILAYAPNENPAIHQEAFLPFVDYLSTCTDKKVVFHQVQSNSAEIEAMRSGRIHIAGFSAGSTTFAVNVAGAVPFGGIGYKNGKLKVDNLVVVVRKDSPYQKLTDLKGKKIVHSSPSANIGHLAPLALFPEAGLIPGKDYKIIFSGKYDQSVAGVNTGDYDAAVLGLIFFKQLAEHKQINEDNFKIIFQGKEEFPSSSWAVSHNLEPNLTKKISQCFFDYEFTSEMSRAMDGTNKFLPLNYKKDWKTARVIAEKNNLKFTRESFNNQK